MLLFIFLAMFYLQYDTGDHLHTSGLATSALDIAVRLHGHRRNGGQPRRGMDCAGPQTNANCDQLLPR